MKNKKDKFLATLIVITILIFSCSPDDRNKNIKAPTPLKKVNKKDKSLDDPDAFFITSRRGLGVFLKAKYVRLYNEKFVQRFSLPAYAIDNDLKNAMAITYTIQPLNAQSCQIIDGKKQCAEAFVCYYDIYLDPQSNFPWRDNTRSNLTFNANYSAFYLKNIQQTDTAIGVEQVLYHSKNNDGESVTYPAKITAYKRHYLPGLSYLRLELACSHATQQGSAFDFITKKNTYRVSLSRKLANKVKQFNYQHQQTLVEKDKLKQQKNVVPKEPINAH
jgi:hypothetical protein